MKKLFLIGLFLPFVSLSQQYKTVDKNGEAIPFVTVYNPELQSGTISDEKGIFKYSAGRTVILSSVSYKKDTVHLSYNCLDICEIVMTKDFIQLDEVIVYSDSKDWKDKQQLGFHNNKREHYAQYQNNPYGYTFLLKIENKRDAPAKLLKAFFDVKNNSKTSMRVRVFSIDSKGEPGRDLLTENVMINKFNFLSGVSINLSKYNIIIPPKGIFIGLDVFKISDDDIKFNLGIVADYTAKSFMGNTFGDDKFYLSERTVIGGPSYLFRNYRFGVKVAY